MKSFCIDYRTDIVLAVEKLRANKSGLGGFLVVQDQNRKVIGVLTDSDISRNLKRINNRDLNLTELMRKDFIRLYDFENLTERAQSITLQLKARNITTDFPINFVPILDKNHELKQVIHISQLIEQLKEELQEVVILGLGFVGLTLAAALAKSGFQVVGIETDETLTNRLNNLDPHVYEPNLREILKNHVGKNFHFYNNIADLAKNRVMHSRRIYIITVGTPFVSQSIDLNAIHTVVKEISSDIREGDMVISRSTVPVGTTRKILGEGLKLSSGLHPGVDFHLVSAPERTIEGRAIEEIYSIPQIISGLTETCVANGVSFFSKICSSTVVAESLEAAEFSKLMSNAYRDTLFNFSNEMAYLAEGFDIDVNRVINDSNLGYPRNQIALPSPGVGGPCLVIDSKMLKSNKQSDNFPSIIIEARKFNDEYIAHISKRVLKQLNANDLVLAIGLAFKGNPPTNDLRDSTGLKICEFLHENGIEVIGIDSMNSEGKMKNKYFSIYESVPIISKNPRALLILNNHLNNVNIVNEILSKLTLKLDFVFDPWQVSDYINMRNKVKFIMTLSKVRPLE